MSDSDKRANGAGFESRYCGRTVLAIGAHPDDLELGIGGTLARLRRGGARVVMAIVSVPGPYDIRVSEARRAAEILGAEIVFLLDAARRIDDLKHYQLVGLLDGLVRDYDPAAILTHSASEFHRDHVSVHGACLATQRLGVFDLFLFNPTMCRPVPTQFHPRMYIDVSDTIEVKLKAIEAHGSQFGSRGLGVDMYRDLARMNGRMVGVSYAEGLDVTRMLA